VFESDSVQELHGQECSAILLADVIDCANVRVIQGRRSLGFTLKARQCLGVSGNVFRQKLQRYKPVQTGVLGFEDDTHASSTQLLQDAVM
jgi:hypothetical protein